MLEKRDEEDITLVGAGLGSIQLLHLGRPLPVGCRLLWALSYRCLHSEGRLEAGVKELPGVFLRLACSETSVSLTCEKGRSLYGGQPFPANILSRGVCSLPECCCRSGRPGRRRAKSSER